MSRNPGVGHLVLLVAAFRAALCPTQCQQGARVLERIGAARVFGERMFEARQRAVDVAVRREQEPAAAREDRKRPRPVERSGALLPRRENLLRLVELAGRDQRFEQVPQLQALCRIEHEGVAS
jgi:hypothetical protein